MTGATTLTFTLLLTDIEGSTRLWEEHPSLMRDVLPRHDQIVAEVVAAAGGRLIKSKGEGDSTFSVFPEPRAAVACSIELQRRLDHELPRAPMQIRVRVALHTGQVDARDDDFFGPTVNRCARIRGAAHGGQILVSDEVARAVAGALPEGASVRDLGAHRFRDVAVPLHVFQIVHPDLHDGFPPMRAIEAVEHNLAAPAQPLIGRSRDVAELRERIERARVVTLTGPGGVGKTRLAVATAFESLDRFDGTWFVDLSPLDPGAQVGDVIARALGVQPGQSGALETIAARIGSMRALIVLDNCEHVAGEAAAAVLGLSGRCVALHVLATSRQPLGLAGESVVTVAPLAVADPEATEPAVIARADAVRLFVERAAAVRPGFALDDDNALDIAGIVRALDGLPLAIELTAAQARSSSVAELSSTVRDLRAPAGADERDRQGSIHATIAWSYGLLGREEREIFARVGEFAGSFSAEVAEALCPEDLAAQVRRVLSDLAQRALVLVEERGGRLRYRMLETIKAFARERLEDSPDGPDVRRRFVGWHAELVRDADDALGGPAASAWFDAIDREYDNVMAALHVAIDQGVDPAEGLATASTMRIYWDTRGLLQAGIDTLERALAAAPDATPRERQRALRQLGLLMRLVGRLERAREIFERALAGAREEGDQAGTRSSLDGLAHVIAEMGQHKRAVERYLESLAIARASGDRPGMAVSLGNIGIQARTVGDLQLARDSVEESIQIFRELGDDRSLAVSMHALAAMLESTDRAAAERTYEETLGRARATGHRILEAAALGNLARVRAMDDLAAARPLFEESLALAHRIGYVVNVVHVLSAYGRAELRAGEHERARPLLVGSVAMAARTLAGPGSAALALGALATITAREGQHELAAILAGAADRHRDVEDQTEPWTDLGPVRDSLRAVLGPRLDELDASGRSMELAQVADLVQRSLLAPLTVA